MSGDVTAAIGRLRTWSDYEDDHVMPIRRDVTSLLAEFERLRAEREALLAARAQHPACDVHGDGPITCGWKSVVRDIDAVLENGPAQ